MVKNNPTVPIGLLIYIIPVQVTSVHIQKKATILTMLKCLKVEQRNLKKLLQVETLPPVLF